MALAPEKATNPIPTVLPRDLAVALFDQEARRITGLSGEQFLARWEAGAYRRDLDETPEGREIAYLALLIPFGRQN